VLSLRVLPLAAITGTFSTRIGTLSLVPRVVNSVNGCARNRDGICSWRCSSANRCCPFYSPRSRISPLCRQALGNERDQTALTNVFTGRLARAIANRMARGTGPMSKLVPDFPLTTASSAPLRVATEAKGPTDFTPLWSGQSVHLARELPVKENTQRLAEETFARLNSYW